MKHVALCSAIMFSVIVLLALSSLSPAIQTSPLRPTPTSPAGISPLCPTPTRTNTVTVTEFEAGGADFVMGVIVGLALTLVCVGVLRWLMRRSNGGT